MLYTNKTLGLRTKLFILSIALILMWIQLGVNIGSVSAATSTSVSLRSNVSASLYDAQIGTNENGQIASFTIAIKNNSASTLPLIDYWAKIKGPNNQSYVTKLASYDKSKETVPANSTVYLTFYASVSKSIKLNQLSIDMIKWDFNASNYENRLGTLQKKSDASQKINEFQEIVFAKEKLKYKLNQYTMYQDQKYSYINVEMDVTNLLTTTTSANELSFQLVTDSMKPFLLTPSYAELSLKGNETKTIMLSTTIPKDELTGKGYLQVLYVQEEINEPIPLGNVLLNEIKNTAAVKVSGKKDLTIENNLIQFSVKENSYHTSDNRTFFNSTLILENKSASGIKLPDVKYYFKTNTGYLYPLQVDESDNIELLPSISEEIKLEGQIPNSKEISKGQLVVFLENENVKNFLANFEIKLTEGNDGKEDNKVTDVTTYDGYKIEQISLQRTPNEKDDLLVAQFKITNTTSKSKAKLDLLGNFVIDSIELGEETTKLIQLDPIIVVAPNQSYNVIAYTTIPYTQEVSNYSVKLSEKTDKNSKYIQNFSKGSLQTAKLLASNESYTIDTLGKRATVDFKKALIYESAQSNIFYTELIYTNTEKRSVEPSQLKGYIQNKYNDIVDVTFVNYKEKLIPGETVVLSAYATVPKSFENERVEFNFGEALSIGEEETEVAVNPVYISHIIKPTTPLDQFDKLPFMQYDLSLKYFIAGLDSADGFNANQIKLEFQYDLELRENAPKYSDKHSVMVEFVEETQPKTVFSKTFEIGATGESGEAFVIGKDVDTQMTYSNDLLGHKYMTDYIVNIYDVYRDHKVLIASKPFRFGLIE